MDKHINGHDNPRMTRQPNDLEAAAATFDDSATLAAELRRMADTTPPNETDAYYLRECAGHIEGLHELLLETQRRMRRLADDAAVTGATEPKAPQDALLRRAEVIARTGLKISTVYDRMRKDDFPRPVKISAKAVAWRESEINTWIKQRTTGGRV